jgi:hypothetical protein
LESAIRCSNNLFDETIDGVELLFNEDVEKGLSDYVAFREKKLSVQASSTLLKKKLSMPLIPSLQEFRDLLDMDVVKDKKGSAPVIPEPTHDSLTEEMLLETSRSKNAGMLHRVKSSEINSSFPVVTDKPQSDHIKKPSSFNRIFVPETPAFQEVRDPRGLKEKEISKDSPARQDAKMNLRATFSSPRSRDFVMMGLGMNTVGF